MEKNNVESVDLTLAAHVRDERKKAFEALLAAAVELSKGGTSQ